MLTNEQVRAAKPTIETVIRAEAIRIALSESRIYNLVPVPVPVPVPVLETGEQVLAEVKARAKLLSVAELKHLVLYASGLYASRLAKSQIQVLKAT